MTQNTTRRRHPARHTRMAVGAVSAMASVALVGSMYALADSSGTTTESGATLSSTTTTTQTSQQSSSAQAAPRGQRPNSSSRGS